VPKTIQIRDIDDDVYAALARRAAEAGVSVPDQLRREAARLASRPTMEEWLARTRRRPSDLTRAQVIEALDELRGPWPNADR
jgi:plasmid stability protein